MPDSDAALAQPVAPDAGPEDTTVSLRAEVPEALVGSMRRFIEQHPSWDQYRLVQVALAGFLVQNGMESRAITRCYLAGLFPARPGFRRP